MASNCTLFINDKGELLAFKLTPGNTDDRKPVADMTQDLIGKLFGDRGYISQELFEKLYEQGLKLITRHKKNMKQKLVKLIDLHFAPQTFFDWNC